MLFGCLPSPVHWCSAAALRPASRPPAPLAHAGGEFLAVRLAAARLRVRITSGGKAEVLRARFWEDSARPADVVCEFHADDVERLRRILALELGRVWFPDGAPADAAEAFSFPHLSASYAGGASCRLVGATDECSVWLCAGSFRRWPRCCI